MDLDGAVALVRQGLGFRTDLEDQIIAALQAAQIELEGDNRSLPEFLKQEDDTLSITASTQAVALPTGFIREFEEEGPNYAGTDGQVYLVKKTKLEADTYYFNFDPGAPRAYVMRKNELLIYPVPDLAYTLTWSWYKSETFPASGGETNLWFTTWPWLLVARAGMELAEDTRAVGAGSPFERFSRLWTTWNTKWMATLASKDDANMPRAMGLNN